MPKHINLQEFKILLVVVFVAICGMLAVDIHLASMPSIMKFLHTDKPHMQQSVSLFLLGMGMSILVYGPLSDKYGRKPIVCTGLLIASISSFAAMFSHTIQFFLLTRLLQGIGSGVCAGVGRIIIADVLQNDRLAKIGSYFSLVTGLSPLLAPATGGYIQAHLGWQANFFVLGAILFLALTIFILFCPETNKHKNPKAFSFYTLSCNFKLLLQHSVFLACTMMTGLAMAVTMIYATVSSFIFQTQFHLSPIAYGWLTAIVGIASIAGKLIVPKAIDLIGSTKTLFTGILFITFAGLFMLLLHFYDSVTISAILAAAFISIMGQTFIAPTIISRALSPFHDKRGAAGALFGGFQMLSAFVCSAVAGSFSHDGILVLATSYTILGLLSLIIYLIALSKT